MRISCPQCGFAPVWTDEPEKFLESVCPASESCEADVTAEKAVPPVGEHGEQEWQIL